MLTKVTTKTSKWCAEIRQDVKSNGFCITIFGKSDTELRRFWYAGIYLLISFFCIGMFNVIAQKRGVQQNVEGPIADLGFDIFYSFTHKLYDYNPWIADQFCYITVGICAVWILLFMGRKNANYERRIVIYKRWMLLVGACFNMRCITVISTVLPRPWKDSQEWTYCNGEDEQDSFTWDLAMGTWEYVIGNKNICYDFFYSGHTVNVVIVALLVHKYSHCIYFKVLVWALAIFTMVSIIAVRAHYTIDIWAALIIAYFLFQIFDLRVRYREGIFAKLEKPECRKGGDSGRIECDYDLQNLKIDKVKRGMQEKKFKFSKSLSFDFDRKKSVKFKKLKQQKSLSGLSLVLSPTGASLKTPHISLNSASEPEDESL